MTDYTRRDFLHIGGGTCVALAATQLVGCERKSEAPRATVYAVLGDELSELHTMGRQAAEALGITGRALVGATVFIKPNFGGAGFNRDIGKGAIRRNGELCRPALRGYNA